ncbi:unnamed protein product [Darwinula stevensoni]|uniref:Uncharacterized protein n=1 Tax=Darwinula stevensoni TaxID=69355 RepID=A0A7R8WYI3_9CRUS|nr:unnamed protein product [Darwinula stevensoni]CAG0878982.1 unnamed protein product [Darwinula stevensoni]
MPQGQGSRSSQGRGLWRPLAALAFPGIYLMTKVSQLKRRHAEDTRRRVTERDLANLNHKISSSSHRARSRKVLGRSPKGREGGEDERIKRSGKGSMRGKEKNPDSHDLSLSSNPIPRLVGFIFQIANKEFTA